MPENNYDIKLEYMASPDRLYDSKAIRGDNLKICLVEKKEKERV